MKYNSFKYIYPPRPKNAIPNSELNFYDNNSLLAQPKMNGSNCTIYTNGESFYVMNRHKQALTNFKLSKEEILSMYKGDGEWMVINGEYLNKNKLDENGKPFNHKFIIFDIIVIDNNHLIGKTFEERVIILDELYGKNESEKSYLYSVSENIYRVKTYYNDFSNLYNDLTRIDVVEGLVLKRKNARLEIGLTENNNSRSQVKARKKTKNYSY